MTTMQHAKVGCKDNNNNNKKKNKPDKQEKQTPKQKTSITHYRYKSSKTRHANKAQRTGCGTIQSTSKGSKILAF